MQNNLKPKSKEWITEVMKRFEVSEEDALTAPDNILNVNFEVELTQAEKEYGLKILERILKEKNDR